MTNAATITIGCTLPHGLGIACGVPGEDSYQSVELKGISKARKGNSYGFTAVPVDLWAKWIGANNTLRYVREAAVFVIENGKKLHPLTLRPLK